MENNESLNYGTEFIEQNQTKHPESKKCAEPT
jgi:hypothetical protein